jgi:hypothetical protein
MRYFWEEHKILLLITTGIALLIAARVWFEFAHPCKRYETSTCYTSTCLVYSNGVCTVSDSRPYSCRVCVER